MKVFDCFLFNGEVEMLKLRLAEMDSAVDRFVIGESKETFRGDVKPLVLPDIQEQLAPWQDKIRVVQIPRRKPRMPPAGGERHASWLRQEYQRSYLRAGLSAAQDNDLVLISDVDEIIRAEAIRSLVRMAEWTQTHKKVRLGQQFHYYYFDCLVEDALQPWTLPVAVTMRRLSSTSCEFERMATRLGVGPEPLIVNAGWHFSWFGGGDYLKRKLKSMSDDRAREMDEVYAAVLEQRREMAQDPLGRDLHYRFTNELPELPQWVTANIEDYRKIGWVHG